MGNKESVFIYHSDLYPSFSRNQNRQQALRRFLSTEHRFISFADTNSFDNYWTNYIFPNHDIPIQVATPNSFSDLYKVITNTHNSYFAFDSPTIVRDTTAAISNRKRTYCLILANMNLIFYLKNIITSHTNMFKRINYIIPTDSRNREFEVNLLDSQTEKTALFINPEIYQNLESFIESANINEFWTFMIHISNQIDLSMIRLSHRQNNTLCLLLTEIFQQSVAADNGGLKEKIIEKLQNDDNLSESKISTLYDLILAYQMQIPRNL